MVLLMEVDRTNTLNHLYEVDIKIAPFNKILDKIWDEISLASVCGIHGNINVIDFCIGMIIDFS